MLSENELKKNKNLKNKIKKTTSKNIASKRNKNEIPELTESVIANPFIYLLFSFCPFLCLTLNTL